MQVTGNHKSGLRDSGEEEVDDSGSSSMRIPTLVLPKTLIDSLYRLEEANKRAKEKPGKHEAERSSHTLQHLMDRLKVIGDQTHIDESILAMSFTHNSSQFSLTPSKATKQKVVRHKLLVSSIAKPPPSSNKVQSIHMKMGEEKARNVKDVNLNINLNLRVFPEQNEYQIFRDKQGTLRSGRLNLGAKQSADSKNPKQIKKLSGSESRGTFRRKAKPEELRASSKDHSSESKLVRKVVPRSKYIDSDHSLSQKKSAAPANSIPVGSLHIPNFGKVITAMGAEYKKASGSRTIRTRKSRNLENILTKYRQFQEKTAEIESARKEKSEKKTIATARSRIGVLESNRPTVVESARQSKVNFKRKKLSLQYPQNNQNSSKELVRPPQPIGINLAAVSLYQTSQPPKLKRDLHKPTNDRSKADTGDSNKDKFAGSASARAHTHQIETSVLQHIVNNLGGKFGNHKLSLSTTTVPILLNHKVTDSKDSTSVKKLVHLDHPKVKRELRQKSGKGTAIIQGSKFTRMMNQDIQRKADSKDNIIKKSRSSAKTLRTAGFKSIDRTQDDKLVKHKTKPDTERPNLGMHSYSKSEIKPAPATFANIHIASGLGLAKSRPQFSIPVSKIQSLLANSKANK